ncbi:hypothetical protein [Streptomyces solicathayae]|uniref:Transcriptional regulator n=1 Tax=Streptomyces solicathayae TaxID=3081768 RepID=A0ABZ0M3J7_9ACTN|nr:hypothetical protein [Streptomyces sp. HUAS YS2]WOX26365.1 hypothetical protein R2D22_35330 [Streptomyces sp. HUAS YS2]
MGELRPLGDDLNDASRALAEAMRELFEGLHVSVRRYAVRRHRDPGTFSRYLNGTRLPPWQVINDLFADLAEHRGTAVTTEAVEFVRRLYASAVDAAPSPKRAVEILEQQLADADRASGWSSVRGDVLGDALLDRTERIADLQARLNQLEADRSAEPAGPGGEEMTEDLRRHVLVVGAQCADAGWLDRLEEAARGLHSVLTDPAFGVCVARTGEHPSLLAGATIASDDIRRAVREAVRRAGEENAVLVVAILGHGFTPTRGADLYYMAADSTGTAGSAINVRQLLLEAVDEPGVEGIIALIDTNHAASAMPDSRSLADGLREGRTRCGRSRR